MRKSGRRLAALTLALSLLLLLLLLSAPALADEPGVGENGAEQDTPVLTGSDPDPAPDEPAGSSGPTPDEPTEPPAPAPDGPTEPSGAAPDEPAEPSGSAPDEPSEPSGAAPDEPADPPAPAPDEPSEPSGSPPEAPEESPEPVPEAPEESPEPAPDAPEASPAQGGAGSDDAEEGLNETGDGITIEPAIQADDPAFLDGQEDDAISYSVDVEWGAMTFWYVTQGWDPKRMRADTSLTGWHVYDYEKDELVDKPSGINAIKVMNRPESAEITAVFSYSGTNGFGIYKGDFTRNFIALSPGETCEVHFMPETIPEDGALPDRKHGSVKIGTIMVEILPPPQTGEDGDGEGWID